MANIFENKSHKCLPKLAILIPKIKDSGITVNSCAETSLNTIFQSILELSQNLFVVGIEGSIVNARENKQDMISSCFHLKGNLFSFNSHKTSIIFFFFSYGRFLFDSPVLSNLDPSAVLGCHRCQGERPGARVEGRGTPAAVKGEEGRGGPGRGAGTPVPPSTPSKHLEERLVSNALKGTGCEMQSQPPVSRL